MLRRSWYPGSTTTAVEWVLYTVSGLLASFLIGLGNKVLYDVGGLTEQRLHVKAFVSPTARQQADAVIAARDADERAARQALEMTQTLRMAAQTRYDEAQASFKSWLATRAVTTDPSLDPVVRTRTLTLDSLGTALNAAMTAEHAADAKVRTAATAAGDARQAIARLTTEAQGAYQRAVFRQETRTFLLRLAITLPLLCLSGWLVWRRRDSQYWPLYRGVVLFGVFAFFVELVPFLPSWGGYVRTLTGIVATVLGGIGVIRYAQAWLARRATVAAEAEASRRERIAVDEGYTAVENRRCPDCDRGIDPADRYCGHCGLQHHAPCPSCTRVLNTYVPFCPTCGIVGPNRATSSAAPTATAADAADGPPAPVHPITLVP